MHLQMKRSGRMQKEFLRIDGFFDVYYEITVYIANY